MQADDTRHANVFYKNDNQTVQLKPEDKLSFHENGPFFLQSSQPLKEVNKKLYMQYFFASSLSFCDGALLYVSLPCLTQDLTFVLDVNRSYTLEAVTPVPCPLPVQFNSKINDPSQTCFCSVFSRTFASGPLRFLFSFEKKFSDCSDFLRTSLKNNGFVSPKICLLNPDSETEELISISSFFSNPGNALSQIYIVAQSDCEYTIRAGSKEVALSELPTKLQPLVQVLVGLIEYSTGDLEDEKFAFARRFISIAVNGGISISHLRALAFVVDNGEPIVFEQELFQRTKLLLEEAPRLFQAQSDGEALFKLPKTCFQKVLRQNSNEFTFCGFFWFPILSSCFLQDTFPLPNLKFLPVQEWPTTKLFGNNKRIDWAILLESLSSAPGSQIDPCPIFVVEAGKDYVADESIHKDETKLSCMMSASCLYLANQMVLAKRKPELVRVYGLLIGGLKAQVLVAHPVITRLGDGQHEIHVHISADESLTMDFLKPSEAAKGKKKSNSIKAFEQLIEGTGDFPNLSGLNVDDFTLRSYSTRPANRQLPAAPFSCGLNEAAFYQCRFVAEMVKARISLIRSDDAIDSSGRSFLPPPDGRKFYFSSGSSTKNTPRADRISFKKRPRSDSPRSPSPRTRLEARALITKELVVRERDHLHLLSSLAPTYFPRLHSCQEETNGRITYGFEVLAPLVTKDGRLLDLFFKDPVTQCARFLLDCSYCLYLMHTQFGLVHADISVRNIMYSTDDKRWKLIDFGHSLPVSESLSTPRSAGTRDFIAPEALETGIFTPESDIWSLGTVCSKLFSCYLLSFAVDGDVDDKGSDDRVVWKLVNSFFKMSDPKPARRLSLLQVMQRAYDCLRILDSVDLDDCAFLGIKYWLDKQASLGEDIEFTSVEAKSIGKR